LVVNKHPLGRRIGSPIGFKDQLTSTAGPRYPFHASENRLKVRRIDEPILQERLRFRCRWVSGCVDFQSKTPHRLIDWHKLSPF
jgi:hypothetical protein